jgi:two-component system, LytTR family, sensor kinase
MDINTGFLKPLKFKQFIIANVLLAFVIVALLMRGSFDSYQNFLLSFVWVFIICITQWTGAALINYLIDLRIKWIKQPILRTFVGMITLVSYAVLAFTAVQFIMLYILYHTAPAEAWQIVSRSIIYTLLISLFMSLTFTAIGFFKAWQRALIKAEKLKAEMMAYKYESLRNQLNPHFLFNSFNVLSDLVYADQAQAVKFIQQMSELFRYVLDSRDKELVPLTEELEFMRSFTYLLKTRFGDKLNIVIDLEAGSGEYIVPMTMQLLVENAVKHNEISEAFPLVITIRKNEDYLEVENSMRLKSAGENSKNTGLKNIEQQFSFFTDKQIEINDANGSFRVRVPILKTIEK